MELRPIKFCAAYETFKIVRALNCCLQFLGDEAKLGSAILIVTRVGSGLNSLQNVEGVLCAHRLLIVPEIAI